MTRWLDDDKTTAAREAPHHQRREEFPPWEWNIPERFNIGAACTDVHLATAAHRVAVIVDDDAIGVRHATYAQLADQTGRFGQLLRNIGIAAGARLLIRLPNCLEYPTVFLGAMKRGVIPVPTSTQLTAEEVLYLLKDSGSTAIVTDRATWNTMHQAIEALDQMTHVWLVGGGDTVRPQRLEVLDLHDALARITSIEPPHATSAADPAYLVYTSGTTGYPKGVLHAHRALIGRQPSSEYWFDFHPEGDRVLHSGKFNWTYVLGTGLMDPLYRGHTTIVHEGSNEPHVWIELIAKHRATIFIGVPTLYRHILQRTSFAGADVPSLRHCMSAGESLSTELLAAWRARFGLEIYEGLGMTECSYYLCQTKSRPVRAGSVGFIQPGHDVKLLDPQTLREVPSGEEGMLCIPQDDPDLMLGYWNQPEETAALLKDGWFLTGDYARQDADGYVCFLGRRDDLIKSFGYRVSPHEVERVFKEHPAVADAAAVGEEVSPGKVLVVAYLIARSGAPLAADECIEYGRRRLASYKAPKIIYLVDEFPRTSNGKVLRRALTPAHAYARSS